MVTSEPAISCGFAARTSTGMRLAFKARQPFRVAAEHVGEDFNGNLPVQVRVLGAIDFAHAAGAELFHDLEMRNSLADLGHAGLP